MKILIVCIQGLTSGILAKRMTAISHDHGDDHEFRACSQFDLAQYQEWADVILLTAQVKSIRSEIEKKYAGSKKIFVISEESMSFSQVNTTYQEILHQINASSKVRPVWQIFVNVIRNTLILCFLLSIPGWIAYGVNDLFASSIARDLYESTARIICVYGACACGYYYAKEIGENIITYLLIGFLSLLAITPGFTIGNIAFAESEFLSMPLPDYSFLMLLLYLPLILLSLYCYQHISLYIKTKFFGKSVIMSDFNMIAFTIICTIDMGFLLVIRGFLSLIM